MGILKIVELRDEIKKTCMAKGTQQAMIIGGNGCVWGNLRIGRSRKICYFRQFVNYYVDYASRFSYFCKCGGEAYTLQLTSG